MQSLSDTQISLPTAENTKWRQWLILLPAMILPFLGAFVYFFGMSNTPWAPRIYGLVKVFTLVYPLLIVVGLERQRPWRPKLTLREHLRSVPMGLITGLAMFVLMGAAFAFTPWGDMFLSHTEQIRAKVAGLGIINHFIPFSIGICVLHSLLEEYYWRWFVYGRTRKLMARSAAHVIAGLAFALHHYVILRGYIPLGYALFFGTFVGVGGIIWSWQYERYKSLLGAWISHALVDAIIFSIGYFILFG